MILIPIAMWAGGALCAAAIRLQVLSYVPPKDWRGWLDLGLRAACWPADALTTMRRTLTQPVKRRPLLSEVRLPSTWGQVSTLPDISLAGIEALRWVDDGGPDPHADANAAETTEPLKPEDA